MNAKNHEQGISLIIVFFIMTIILSVVLGLSIILLSEFKRTKSVGESLSAFYSADSGIEKLLYYNRKKTPVGATGGICSICDSCSGLDCECTKVGEDCEKCTSCRIIIKETINSANNQKYQADAIIYPIGDFYNLDISVKGFYKNTSRAIGLQIANKDLSSSAPEISMESAVRSNDIVTISADINDIPEGVNPTSVYAHIRNSNNPRDPDVETIWLELVEGEGSITYRGLWNNSGGYYFVYVRACDLLGNCGESKKFPITD